MPHNKPELARLITHYAIRRIAGFGNGMLSVVFFSLFD
jgi:hypothetical protein